MMGKSMASLKSAADLLNPASLAKSGMFAARDDYEVVVGRRKGSSVIRRRNRTPFSPRIRMMPSAGKPKKRKTINIEDMAAGVATDRSAAPSPKKKPRVAWAPMGTAKVKKGPKRKKNKNKKRKGGKGKGKAKAKANGNVSTKASLLQAVVHGHPFRVEEMRGVGVSSSVPRVRAGGIEGLLVSGDSRPAFA